MTPEQQKEYLNLQLKFEERFDIKAAFELLMAGAALILGISIFAQPEPTFLMKSVAVISLCVFVRLVMGNPTTLKLTDESRARLREWKTREGLNIDDDIFDE